MRPADVSLVDAKVHEIPGVGRPSKGFHAGEVVGEPRPVSRLTIVDPDIPSLIARAHLDGDPFAIGGNLRPREISGIERTRPPGSGILRDIDERALFTTKANADETEVGRRDHRLRSGRAPLGVRVRRASSDVTYQRNPTDTQRDTTRGDHEPATTRE